MDYSTFLFVQFIRYFLIAFALLLGITSGWLYFNPEAYWKITKRSLKFKGITGGKPSKRFYWWVKTSALVQITMSLAILFVLYIKR
ncbi:MAG: hypothetical protein TR69_WS6001000857 [candidate division WS6 bacterium OLB20]|uniref:Uncharacterized protein n=1 Tax=candidate division WS6 bacterium OLB20 TaxID=1617426 RepID=A0A136LZ12_9BACT|nr:MAG: hypothetical protein TR69_WS6001000857 [candidate division WS6 bacterium OLB20]